MHCDHNQLKFFWLFSTNIPLLWTWTNEFWQIVSFFSLWNLLICSTVRFYTWNMIQIDMSKRCKADFVGWILFMPFRTLIIGTIHKQIQKAFPVIECVLSTNKSHGIFRWFQLIDFKATNSLVIYSIYVLEQRMYCETAC